MENDKIVLYMSIDWSDVNEYIFQIMLIRE